MSEASQSWGSLTWGEATELRPPEPFGSRTSQATLVVWRPNQVLGLGSIEGLAIELICCELSGERLILPLGSPSNRQNPYSLFFHQAWVCGFAILEQILGDRLTPEHRFSYRMSWFLFRRLQHMRASTTRRFNSKKDFIVSRDAAEGGSRELLPWLANQATPEAGYPQTLDQMLEQGREAAEQDRIASPTTAQRLHYGLAVAARIGSPERLSGDEIRKLVQYAMLAAAPDEQRMVEHREAAVAEVLAVIEPHVFSDEDQALFDLWFQGPKNSFVKQVAQRLHGIETSEAREVVTDVLLTLAFDSHWHVAQCVQAVMRDVLHFLDDQLNPSERLAFGQLFMPQHSFADLPLIMLREKLEFCEGILWDLLTDPSNPDVVDAFHRLLTFYGILLRERRDADVRRHRWSEPRFEFDEDRDSPIAGDEQEEVESRELVTAVVTSIQRAGDFACSCSEPELEYLDLNLEAGVANITCRCRRCGAEQSVIRSLEELRRLAGA